VHHLADIATNAPRHDPRRAGDVAELRGLLSHAEAVARVLAALGPCPEEADAVGVLQEHLANVLRRARGMTGGRADGAKTGGGGCVTGTINATA
jgi:hypothetical protein